MELRKEREGGGGSERRLPPSVAAANYAAAVARCSGEQPQRTGRRRGARPAKRGVENTSGPTRSYEVHSVAANLIGKGVVAVGGGAWVGPSRRRRKLRRQRRLGGTRPSTRAKNNRRAAAAAPAPAAAAAPAAGDTRRHC